jgi:hypothetical protein
MRKLSIFLAFILVVTFGQASLFAQTCEISVDNITNSWNGGTKLMAGQLHHAGIRVNATCLPTYEAGDPPVTTPSRYNVTNTILVYSPGDLAEWNFTVGSLLPTWLTLGWTTEVYIHFHKVSGSGIFDFYGYTTPPPSPPTPIPDDKGNDSVAITFGGSSTWEGLTNLFNDVAWDIYFQSRYEDEGDQICFDSVSQGLAGGSAWKWAPLTEPEGDHFPIWQGPYCYTVSEMPNMPPEIVGPTAYSFSHCAEASIDFVAWEEERDHPYTWEVVGGGPGIITSTGDTTATWTWSGGSVPQCSNNTLLIVRAADAISGTHWGTPDTVNISVTNAAPAFSDDVLGPAPISTNTWKAQYYSVSDPCNDALTVTIISDGGIDAASEVYADLDSIWYYPAEADEGNVTMLLEVCDEVDQGCGLCDTMQVEWVVSVGAPYRVRIEKEEGPEGWGALQGHLTEVSVVLEDYDATPEGGLGGFDFLFAYDASALSFQDAVEGVIPTNCEWEYFTHRQGGECSSCPSGCPTGEVRVVGLAELNNGPYHPLCDVLEEDVPGTLFDLVFLVSNNRTFDCSFAPIRFWWCDCGDNTLSNRDGSLLIISSQVWDYVGAGGYITEDYRRIDGEDEYPTFKGHQDDCVGTQKAEPLAALDLFNGGVDIACADLIDDRGDINLNGITYEIADAVMFTNYFIIGEDAFGTDPYRKAASIAASDVNADGIPLSVADLVYLIRVIIGDAVEIPKVNPAHATFSHENDVLSVSGEMGAAFIVVEGKVTPTLLAGNMELKYGYSDQNTRILVYNHQGRESFSGDFLRTEGEIVSIEFATYEGQPVEARNVPRSFSVEQNYPNPFNAETVIKFAMPNAGNWRVSIYNVTGQLVEEFSGTAEAGGQEVRWDATGRASGIYFYKVVAGNQTETKKAVYLK